MNFYVSRYARAGRLCITRQTLLVMKLSAMFLLLTALHVSANTHSQVISYAGKKVSLSAVFKEISKQTGYLVVYKKLLVEKAPAASVNVVKMPLPQFLDQLLEGRSLKYTIESKTVIIAEKGSDSYKTDDPAYEQYFYAPPADIRGRIVDSTGHPLANVTIQGSKGKTAVTNESGEFVLTGVAPGDELVISFVGYVTRRITAGDEAVTIVLHQDVHQMEELNVISTGYQSLPRERMTGSFSSVQVKRLSSKLQPSLLTALEGQAAGMVVTKEGRLEIRGKSTFVANAEPLVVVDGYPISGGLEMVNIDNVESITVLKDAVAASIYGARSSNGVIVITTKNGRKGKFQMSYKGSGGVTLRPDLSYMNKTGAADYVEAEMAVYNISPSAIAFDYDYYGNAARVTQLLVSRDRGVLTPAQVDTELAQLKNNDGLGQLEKYVFRPKLTQQHNLSFTSGSDKSFTNAAIRYIGNRNNMIGNKDNRVIFDLKNDWKPVNNVTVRLFSNINFSNSTAPVRTAANLLTYSTAMNSNQGLLTPYSLMVDPSTGLPASVAIARPDVISRYAPIQGLKPMTFEPLRDLLLETNTIQNYQARMGATIIVNIIDGLAAEAGGIWTRGSLLNRSLYNVDAYRVRAMYNGATSRTTNSKHYVPDGSIVNETRNMNEAYTFRGQLSFNRTVGAKHRIMAIAGGEINKDFYDNNAYPTRYGYNEQAGSSVTFNYADYGSGAYTPDYLLSTAQLYIPGVASGYTLRDNRFVSMYANGSYEYDSRFLLSGSMRIDQANFFGTNPKYRYKPNWSVGGTYKLANEKFFDISWINKLNLRGSFGINGNISLSQGPFLLLGVGGFSPVSGGVSYSITSPPNPDLRWERTHITNIGADVAFLKGRLQASVDYYHKLSKDLLAPDGIDATYGRESVTRNAGTARNTGIELSLEADVLRNSKLSWNIFFNGSYNTSKVLQFNYTYQYSTNLTLGSSASMFGGNGLGALRTDYPIDAVFSYEFAGLNNTGTPTFYNSEKNKVLGGGVTMKDLVYSGTIRPKYVLNMTNTFSWQRFDLSFMLISQMGSVFRRDAFYGNNFENKYVTQRWRQPGDEARTIYPRLSNSSSDTWYYPYSDVLVESGNYIKLRDLTLGYTFNDKIWGKSGFNNMKLYFQGRNLWMSTANKDNIDPETMTNTTGGVVVRNLPLRPEYYVGLSVNF